MTLCQSVPLYSPESVQFLKTEKPCVLAKLMRINADSWELLNVEELKTKQERHRKQSCESEASHEESTSKE